MKAVTVANFVRAETDHMIRANMKASGELGPTMRLYNPMLAILDGTGTPPPVRKV